MRNYLFHTLFHFKNVGKKTKCEKNNTHIFGFIFLKVRIRTLIRRYISYPDPESRTRKFVLVDHTGLSCDPHTPGVVTRIDADESVAIPTQRTYPKYVFHIRLLSKVDKDFDFILEDFSVKHVKTQTLCF